MCRALVRLKDDRRIRVFLHVLLHDGCGLCDAYGMIVNGNMSLFVDRHDDGKLCRCRRRLRLRELHSKCLLGDRLQTVHHEEDEQEEDDVNHRDDHELRLLFEPIIVEIHCAAQLSFFAVTIVVQRRSVSVTIASS